MSGRELLGLVGLIGGCERLGNSRSPGGSTPASSVVRRHEFLTAAQSSGVSAADHPLQPRDRCRQGDTR